MSLKRNFGKRLQQVRQARGLTQETLAEVLGVHVRTVRHMEAGVYSPRFDTLEKLAEVLGVEVKALFSFGDEEKAEEND